MMARCRNRHAKSVIKTRRDHRKIGLKRERKRKVILAYAWRLVTRNPRRSATYLFGLALAVGLFAGILFFVDATTRQMTATALAPVKLDLVAHATKPDVNVADMVPTLSAQRGKEGTVLPIPVPSPPKGEGTKLRGDATGDGR